MSEKSKISWTDSTWNPVVGCCKVSEGCKNCYAENEHNKRHKAFQEGKLQNIKQYAKPFNEVQLFEDRLEKPLRWKKPRKVFVNSLSDLFHPDVPFEFIDQVFAVMALCPQHTFQVLTKRPERMQEYFSFEHRDVKILTEMQMITAELDDIKDEEEIRKNQVEELQLLENGLPLKNVWIGVTAENQERADERIPILLQIPAAVRFVSVEPMLGPINISRYLRLSQFEKDYYKLVEQCGGESMMPDYLIWNGKKPACLHLIICGGESGPNARPMHPDWARSLRDQCTAAGVKFFFKQWGEYAPFNMEKESVFYKNIAILKTGRIKTVSFDEFNYYNNTNITSALMTRFGTKQAGNLLDGQTWQQMPEVK